jgi:hypothetical protein
MSGLRICYKENVTSDRYKENISINSKFDNLRLSCLSCPLGQLLVISNF